MDAALVAHQEGASLGGSFRQQAHNGHPGVRACIHLAEMLHHVLGRLLQMLGNAKQVLGIQKDIFSVGTALPALGAMKLEGLVRPDGYVSRFSAMCCSLGSIMIPPLF